MAYEYSVYKKTKNSTMNAQNDIQTNGILHGIQHIIKFL